MTELLTAAQMRALERRAIDSDIVSGLTLMERAGRGVVAAVLAHWPDLATGARRARVLCGPGNNGGDGFVIARRLHAHGWQVDLRLYGDPDRLPPDALRNHAIWCAIGKVHPWDAEAILATDPPDLIVDAVFGIGLTRPVPDSVARVLAAVRHGAGNGPGGTRIVAVDCPSGLNLDTGMTANGDAPDSDFNAPMGSHLTVTFHSAKPGHYIGAGPALCQVLRVVDIGLGAADLPCTAKDQPPDPGRVRLVGADADGACPANGWPLDLISKERGGGHKFDHGHVIVFAGGVGQGGAGRLAARAALRAGAGLVTLLCPPSALQENACQLTAIMLRSLSGAEGLDAVADDRVTGFCLGPGMGVSGQTRDRVLAVLARRSTDPSRRNPAVVLDADALTSFADCPANLFSAVHDRVALTPHEGEFARLFPDLAMAGRGSRSKIDAVREAAARAGCVVLLKGPDTVIAAPDGAASLHAAVYGRSAPWLATAGAGDVLAGLIAGLAAPQGAGDLFRMAEVAAFLHVECARAFGPGLIAEDLTESLPGVLKALRDRRGDPQSGPMRGGTPAPAVAG